jgi:hypothetical protein
MPILAIDSTKIEVRYYVVKRSGETLQAEHRVATESVLLFEAQMKSQPNSPKIWSIPHCTKSRFTGAEWYSLVVEHDIPILVGPSGLIAALQPCSLA